MKTVQPELDESSEEEELEQLTLADSLAPPEEEQPASQQPTTAERSDAESQPEAPLPHPEPPAQTQPASLSPPQHLQTIESNVGVAGTEETYRPDVNLHASGL
ncbi:E1A-binding protein p400-like [Eublepharis macularius]|uniref:E1A-binding protein p400-like n=1 Tax=Eublepharis macularius TaxID=481883 RepID=A0AA97JRV6_EUBMA|nr:E1A-binding protein p400-like [Eublepharis macularius]